MKNKYKVEVTIPMVITAIDEVEAVGIAAQNLAYDYKTYSKDVGIKVEKINK